MGHLIQNVGASPQSARRALNTTLLSLIFWKNLNKLGWRLFLPQLYIENFSSNTKQKLKIILFIGFFLDPKEQSLKMGRFTHLFVFLFPVAFANQVTTVSEILINRKSKREREREE